MTQRSSPKRDFMQVGRAIVEQAIGEHMDGTALDKKPEDRRNAHAVAIGRVGGQKGGKARAKKLSAEERTQIAKMAANARWHQKEKSD